ncbi:MAG TPA: Uma2 family endonuclease [Bryobacterales bacterium]|nr:Uma2 family endonuclease [Bryobacterales bacterium]
MASMTIVSVDEYLHTSFPDGDREYIDGVILERNFGEIDHAGVQSRILICLATHYPQFWAAVEVRVQVQASRFRVPDVCLVRGPEPEGSIILRPPFVVIEVLSRNDRADELQEKIDDHLAFGVNYVWVVNPRTRRGYVHTSEGSREAKDGVLRTQDPEIALPLAEMFSPAR